MKTATITHENITANGWAFLAADFFTRIDAYKADEERSMRECMSNRDEYDLEAIRAVIAYHQRHGLKNGLRVAREILAERLAEQAVALLTAPQGRTTNVYTVAGVQFKSAKVVTHCVVKDGGTIMAKCGSLDLAQKAKAKDERLYPHLAGRLQVMPVNA